MDSSFMIKDPNTDANSHSPTFFLHDGFSSSQVSDIEMMTIQSIPYTSLKDLLSPRMQPGISSSPKAHDHYNSSSWNHDQEIPIKNPLVKQAALAYLQPMSSPRAVVEKGSFGTTIKGMCSAESGCLSWLYDVVWKKNVTGAAWENREEVDDEDEVDWKLK